MLLYVLKCKKRRLSGLFLDIAASRNWNYVEQIKKGWSSDEKYLVRTKSDDCLILRIADIEQYSAKKKEFEIIGKYSELGFIMSLPEEFGICNEGKNVYMLLSWVKGQELESELPRLSEKEQYSAGRMAGEILRKIHSIRLDPEDIPCCTKKEKKLLQLAKYEKSGMRIDGDETALNFVKENIDLIWKTAPVYLHGDFHPGNLIYTEDHSIGVIDFNRWEVGDPYEEFYKLESFGAERSIPYCIGQIDAYFNDDIPSDFWTINAVYVAQASLFSIKWAEKFGQNDINRMVDRAKRAFLDFDDFRMTVPKWYTDKYRMNN